MSLFSFAFLVLVGIFFLCAVIVDLVRISQQNKSDDYIIPSNWKSQIYDERSEQKTADHIPSDKDAESMEAATDWKNYDPHHQPPPKKLRWSAWFTIFFLIPYLLCLFFLANRVRWDDEEEDSSNKDSRIQFDELMISGRIFAGVASA